MIFNIDTCQMVSLPKISDPRGNLTFIENGSYIPFDIQCVYYLYNVPGGSERGVTPTRGDTNSPSPCQAALTWCSMMGRIRSVLTSPALTMSL